MLRLTLTPVGIKSQVELDGHDISRYLTAVTVSADVHGVTKAELSYRGAVVVEGEAGTIVLREAPLHVTCDKCGGTVRGNPDPPGDVYVNRKP